ncbi:hypothetical protein EYF80_047564 [Liparis tanakae]|uniref:Uncharacterized protein n=1 Tax=Liparis tanakae TaxID=230148 RepID=A0A4Z2FM85_9TELE|nr:hypothetical protein EYF80_047564 [Liparis tanakae]
MERETLKSPSCGGGVPVGWEPQVTLYDVHKLTAIRKEERSPNTWWPGGRRQLNTGTRDFYTTRGVSPWWSGERMQLQHMKRRLLYNQRSRPLVVRREKAA